MRKLTSLTIFSALLLSLTGFAPDTRKVNGKVVSFSESFPLEGVSVVVKGTSNQTGTMIDGTFTLELKPEDKVLTFTLQGYKSQDLALDPSKADYVIALQSQ
ncbi:carboxypeptidase-like regulatory domain-containing protein [Flavihumibacter petaseus]|nr:carboxypeptidase-like regulatory domain-containing protein [Flavihumibacter petaseus]